MRVRLSYLIQILCPNLRLCSWAKLVQRLQELGFEGPYAGRKHPQMSRGDLTVIIPNPHHGDIGVGLLQRILRQAGISRSEWLGK